MTILFARFFRRLGLRSAQEDAADLPSRHSAFLAALPEAVLVTEPEGAVVYANEQARALLGSASERSLRRFPELLSAASFEAYRSMRRACLEPNDGPLTPRLDLELRLPSGARAIELRLHACRAGERLCLLHSISDVTDRRHVEDLIARSRDFYLSLLDGLPGLLWRSGPDGARTYFSRSWLEFTGKPMEAQLGDGWLEQLHPTDAKACAKGIREALLERRARVTEYRLRRNDGEYRWIVERSAPVRAPDGSVDGFIGACFDATDSKRLQEAEDIARRDSHQRRFVANVSHELRTPIAAIRGFAETLRLGAIQQPKVALEFVATIERHAERLQRLIEDLLQLSLIESGKRQARPEAVELAPFIWEFYKGLAPAADRKKVRLRVDVAAGLALWVDRGQLGQILQNLCDNAIKFNRRGGTVSLEASVAGAEAVVAVKDTGPGVAPEQMPFLFERFQRPSKTAEDGASGTGLGLSIAKALVEINGGMLWAESSARGACFKFRLPIPPPSPAPPPQEPPSISWVGS